MSTPVVLPIGPMNLDIGPNPGEHSWVIRDAWDIGAGLERVPAWTTSGAATITTINGEGVCGAAPWTGGQPHRIYVATNTQLWEVSSSTATDVSGSAYTNNTNWVRFAQFGPWCLAANGVDKLQIIEVPAAIGGAQNFSDHDSNTYATISSLSAVISPRYICSHKNHVIAADITFKSNYGSIGSFSTTGAGFTNQPEALVATYDAIEITSTSATDTSPRTATIYGTTEGNGDAVSYEVVTLAGLGVATSTEVQWKKILAVKLSNAAVGTVTFRRASDNATITQIAPAGTSSGVYSVPAANQQIGGVTVTMAADAATTRSVGLGGDSNSSGDYDYDSQALSGTTSVVSNMSYVTLLEVFTGDLEAARTVTVSIYAFPAGTRKPYMWWVSATDSAINFGDETFAPSLTGSTREEALDGEGSLTGVIDGGDAWYLFKEKSIYKIVGPPWQPKIISRSVGMKAFNVPYRQGERIYFWSTFGLYYVDTLTDEVVNLFDGRMQIATSSYANFNYGFLSGAYPDPSQITTQATGTWVLDDYVNISGDSRFGLVYIKNIAPQYKSIIVYNKHNDAFFLLTQGEMTGLVTNFVETPMGSASPFPGSSILAIATTGANHQVWYTVPGGFSSGTVSDTASYVALPFKVLSGDQYIPTQIQAIRPLFNSNHFSSTNNKLLVGARVISVSGQNKSWKLDGKLSLSDTYSLDGWVKVNNCPFATKHSIGFTIDKGATGTGHRAGFSGLVGVEVMYTAGPRQAQ